MIWAFPGTKPHGTGLAALVVGPDAPQHGAGCSLSYVLVAGSFAMRTPWAGQDHSGPRDRKACWVLCGGNERKVSGREGLASGPAVCPDMSGGIWDAGSWGHWDLEQSWRWVASRWKCSSLALGDLPAGTLAAALAEAPAALTAPPCFTVTVTTAVPRPSARTSRRPRRWSRCWALAGSPTAWSSMRLMGPPRWASWVPGQWVGGWAVWAVAHSTPCMSPQAAINVLLSIIDRKGPKEAELGGRAVLAGEGRRPRAEGGLLMRPVICICNDQ